MQNSNVVIQTRLVNVPTINNAMNDGFDATMLIVGQHFSVIISKRGDKSKNFAIGERRHILMVT